MSVFFTSDFHIGHSNVIRFDNRPFASVEEMNEELIRKWNKKVKPGDLTYCLGDMFWKGDCDFIQSTLRRLNGSIILIKGNHDHWLYNAGNRKLLVSVKDYADIKVILQNGEVKRCILSHYFMPFYNGHYYGSILLHGHSHNTKEHFEELRIAKELNEKGYTNQIYNVGTMFWNYEPVTLDEILIGDVLNEYQIQK